MLEIKDLQANVSETPILHGLNLNVPQGARAAIMGPNGSGKSTLAAVLAGHPSYTVTGGSISWQGKDLLAMAPEERAASGVFLSFQYPPAIPGVSVSHFLKLALNSLEAARGEQPTALAPFIKNLRAQLKVLELPASFAERAVHDGMSGGERKRLEVLQLLVLQPSLVILDEVDSGLDIDAIRIVAAAVAQLPKETTVLAITHYQRLLSHLTPDSVHVLKDGLVVQSGGPELAHQLEREGYAAYETQEVA